MADRMPVRLGAMTRGDDRGRLSGRNPGNILGIRRGVQGGSMAGRFFTASAGNDIIGCVNGLQSLPMRFAVPASARCPLGKSVCARHSLWDEDAHNMIIKCECIYVSMVIRN